MSKMEFDMAWKKMLLPIAVAMMTVCFAQEGNFLSEDVSFSRNLSAGLEKVYVDLDQLLINENGIFLAFSDSILPVSALFRDQRGFYVMESQLEQGYTLEECPNGHVSRHNDGRCNQRSCPYFRG